ncbi:putative G-protein coupled receptor Mth-like 10 [Oratosquilla oratoria]|uniref:putative G-protein coupled receptor Mth-like 10 n=1 Tax=Oratosquilla oratoria TaxID=337810 RepID=UPI003F76B7E4
MAERRTHHLVHLLLLVLWSSLHIEANQTTESSSTSSISEIPEIPEISTSEYDGPVEAEVPFCCGAGHIFNMSSFGCEPSDSVAPPEFHHENGLPVEYPFAYRVIPGFPHCSFYTLEPTENPGDAFTILPDGRLQMTESPSHKFEHDQYCLLLTAHDTDAVVCFSEGEESQFNHVVYQILYPVGLLVSAFFLLLVFLVYCLLAELRDLLGLCLMCNVGSLFLAQLSTAIAQLHSGSITRIPCFVIALMIHFWFLAAFFWLSVISFNVFWTFWRRTAPRRLDGWTRFGLYALYAWGVPLVITLVAFIRDLAAPEASLLPKPHFAVSACWFSGPLHNLAPVVFFYGPIAVVLTCNLVLFCLTAYKLRSLNKKSMAKDFQFSQYLTLLLLMGITWILEVVSFFVQRSHNEMWLNYIWLVFDLINIMQSVLIFFVFVCRKSVLARLCGRLCGAEFAKKHFKEAWQPEDNDQLSVEIKHSVI